MKNKMWVIGMIMVLVAALCGCGSKGNTLFENASPDTSALVLYCYDGETITRGSIYEQAEEEEILTSLGSVEVKKAKSWTTEEITYPIYGLWIGGKEYSSIEAAWTNGYLITQEGEVYQFTYDFEQLEADYSWESKNTFDSTTVLPCARYLSQFDDAWVSTLLTSAEESEAPEYVFLEITEQREDGLTVKLNNRSSVQDWTYGSAYSLNVLLEDKWYQVPTIPGSWAFDMVAYNLAAGHSTTKEISLKSYGKLPEGTYQLMLEGLTAEFEIE